MLKVVDTEELCRELRKYGMDEDKARTAIRETRNHEVYAVGCWVKAGKDWRCGINPKPPYLYYRCSNCESVFANSDKDSYCRKCGAAMQTNENNGGDAT